MLILRYKTQSNLKVKVSWSLNILMLKFKDSGAGEMARYLRTLVILAEDPGSVLSTHKVAHDYL